MTDAGKNDTTEAPNPFLPSPDDLQHWASVMGRAQQMMLEYALGQANQGNSAAAEPAVPGAKGLKPEPKPLAIQPAGWLKTARR